MYVFLGVSQIMASLEEPMTRAERLKQLAPCALESVANAKTFLDYFCNRNVTDVYATSIFRHPSFRSLIEDVLKKGFPYSCHFPDVERDLRTFKIALVKTFNEQRLLNPTRFSCAIQYPAYLDISEELTMFRNWIRDHGVWIDHEPRTFHLMSLDEPMMGIRFKFISIDM
jgi:hypothetical protein